ncbi:S1C family serine protease [Acetivibrio cellulolyticus]|uniref:S1C family serine protease n=1 Tax=Acetivibrio cellulolyticus TaxID=35830 RepID=UPI0001E2F62E|nr:trypsin-like peptidase domain-containing protein [Acetivibrio cellulolyticus]
MDNNENRDYGMNNDNGFNETNNVNENREAVNNADEFKENRVYESDYNNYNTGSNNERNNQNIISYNTESKSESNLKEASFYTENYVKPEKKKKGILGQLVLVSVISSILGGCTVGVFLQFGVPAVQPSIKSFLNEVGISSGSTENTLSNGSVSSDNYKKVVIESKDSAVVAVAEKVGPSVVGISVKFQSQNFFFGAQEGSASGSGIIIKSNGYIMTNNHVISEALQDYSNKTLNGAKIEVILPNEVDKPYSATVVGRDEKTDLAVLKIEATNLPAIEMGNSDEVKVGEMAVAIGNPGGLEYMGSVTVGVISGLNRTISIDENNGLKLIQTDAAINPGNSGGALVNSEGKLIGINTAKISGDGFEGLGFAIPVNNAKEITDNLIEYKYVKGRPSIGISINQSFNEDIAARYNVPAGVLIEEVSPLSGAYNAGLKRGDIITKVDGKVIKTYSELNDIKNKHKVGEKIKLEVYRDGKTLTVEVLLGEDKGSN